MDRTAGHDVPETLLNEDDRNEVSNIAECVERQTEVQSTPNEVDEEAADWIETPSSLQEHGDSRQFEGDHVHAEEEDTTNNNDDEGGNNDAAAVLEAETSVSLGEEIGNSFTTNGNGILEQESGIIGGLGRIGFSVVPERHDIHVRTNLIADAPPSTTSPVASQSAVQSQNTDTDSGANNNITANYSSQSSEPMTFYPTTRRWASRAPSALNLAMRANDKYPHDCYSFIALYGHQTDTPWTWQRVLCFLFGLLPFIFQIILLVLLAFSKTNELRGTIGETDNPDQGREGLLGLFANFTPANSTPIIKTTQIVSLAAYAIFPDSSLQDVVRAFQLFPLGSACRRKGLGYLRFSCILRLTQGIVGMIVTLILVLTSSTVVDIILNFTAVNFISGLDDDAFALALAGEFSPALQEEAKRIIATTLPPCRFKDKESKWKCYKKVTLLVVGFLVAMISSVFAFQNSSNIWVTQVLRIQFQEETGLNDYSGCFVMDTDLRSIEFSRRTYNSFDTGPLGTSIGYCREERQWILFGANTTTDPCNATVLARSSKTDTFDISTMFEESWVSASNTPLDLYFFDGSDETDMHCDLFLDDGNCDPVFNELGYGYDGGDCCAATCTKSNCGRGGLSSIFRNAEVSGDGYENCDDPEMYPITIHLNDMTSRRDPEFTKWKQLSDTPHPWRWDRDENEFAKWMDAEPVNTYMSLDCDGKNVMTVYVDNSMVNQSQTVMVEDGAQCTLVVRSTTTNLDIIDDDPIWYIDYTIFYDEPISGNNAFETVEILTGDSADVESVTFTRIPECYFEKLHNHLDVEAMYTGNSSSNQAVDWLLEDADPKLQCEDPNFLERYALVKLNFAMNPTELFITHDEQCRWASINCDEGKVVSIQLQEQGLGGDLPSEIGLISNVQALKLGEQHKNFCTNCIL